MRVDLSISSFERIVASDGTPLPQFLTKWNALLAQVATMQAIIDALGDTYVAKDQGTPDWAAPTGTISRATYATGTVTASQLAQRVAALQADLTANGVIK